MRRGYCNVHKIPCGADWPRVWVSGAEDRYAGVMVPLLNAVMRSKWRKPLGSWRKPRNSRLWYSWGTSAALISRKGRVQATQEISEAHPDDFLKQPVKVITRIDLLNLQLQARKSKAGDG